VLLALAAAMLVGVLLSPRPAGAWDSESWLNPTRPTHTLMTRWAVEQLQESRPQVGEFRDQLIEGSNVEVHELPIKCERYGVDTNAKRGTRYVGTNAGCKHPELIWEDSMKAHEEGDDKLAFFLLGVLLHQIQDMGARQFRVHGPVELEARCGEHQQEEAMPGRSVGLL
jgi:hypothetical protein